MASLSVPEAHRLLRNLPRTLPRMWLTRRMIPSFPSTVSSPSRPLRPNKDKSAQWMAKSLRLEKTAIAVEAAPRTGGASVRGANTPAARPSHLEWSVHVRLLLLRMLSLHNRKQVSSDETLKMMIAMLAMSA